MTLKDLQIQRTYVISMDRNQEKASFACRELREIGLEPIVISAIDATEMQLMSPKIDRPGAIGCLLSHRFCLQDAVINGYERIAIFEDDIVKPDNYRQIEDNFLNTLMRVIYIGDIDMLWLGWNDRENCKRYYHEYSNVLIPNKPYGTQAILYNNSETIKKVFELSKNLEHWDVALEKFSQECHCYLPYETMFDQRRHLSDIYPDHRHHYKDAWYVTKDENGK